MTYFLTCLKLKLIFQYWKLFKKENFVIVQHLALLKVAYEEQKRRKKKYKYIKNEMDYYIEIVDSLLKRWWE